MNLDKNGQWATPIAISSNGIAYLANPRLLVGVNNDIQVVWREGTYIPQQRYYAYRDEHRTWSGPITVPMQNPDLIENFKVALDLQDNLHVVWSQAVQGSQLRIFYAMPV